MESTDAAPDDSPDESPDEPTLDIHVEPTTAAIIADTSLALLGAVSQIDRLEARQSAWKAEFIDQARRIALMTEEAVITVGKNFSPAQRQDLARRAFISEVACELRIPERSAIALIDESEALMHRLPLTLAALREGEITYRHAQYLIDETATLDPDAAGQLERGALPFARNLTPARFRQKARTLRERLRPESAVDRREKCSSDRKVEYIPARDGMAWLSLYTTAPVAGALFTSIRTQSVSLQGPAESRTLGQLDADVCADALFDGLTGTLGEAGEQGAPECADPSLSAGADAAQAAPGSGPGSKPGAALRRITPNVTVTVPILSLLGRSDEPATLDGFGPIDIEMARKLVGQATSFTRILTDPDSGAAVVWGTRRYKPTTTMKKFLRYRDQRCRFPGCNRVAEFCDIDHTIPYGFGGETELDNLAALCPKHHRMKHDTTWKVEQLGGGRLRWTSPNGRTYPTHPENEVRPFTPKTTAPSSDPPPF
ncbi:HNH endonuclease [Mycetocola manganoxydans]|uniref:HNH endonuclease n=1 Tax=Mycetocola manganoxydans TaxID=699879 RepID=A0A3L6ZYV9_9MICO|nr:HNH endonuclease signature motif containing protein [Mycetocola manganoxydans]RLP72918.1 HNH endonuclease [Mycetocola manganoxydans]GHD44992.1 HNH endonuclease [Mycetocola manganoxydans]